jgi:phosphonate transport system substrate-binding protein
MPKLHFRPLVVFAALLVALVAVTLFLYRVTTDITVPFPPIAGAPISAAAKEAKPLRTIGVVSRYPPPVIYRGYQPLMDYLSEHTPYRFELRTGSTYQETVDQLVRGEVAAAFLGTFIYLRAHERYGVRAILRPLNENGEPSSRSVLITTGKSPIRGIKDLRGKRIAVPSQDSFSGNWLPLAELPRWGFSPADMPVVRHFSHHQSVVYQVLKGSFDAGVVKDRVAREYADRDIRIVLSSPPIPGSPLTVSRECDPALVAALRSALLAIDVRRPADRELVAAWDQEFHWGFAEANDSQYDSLRQMLHTRTGGRP